MPFILSFYGTCEDGTGGADPTAGGGGASAPTSVSIATSSSGNYNNAVIVEEVAVGFELMETNGDSFSSNNHSMTVDLSEMASAFDGNSGQSSTTVKGYIRATGATSFQWGLANNTLVTSLTNGSVSVTGTASTAQDRTSTHMGQTGVLTFGGGRGGILYPSAGDTLAFIVSASATNSNGTTNASTVTFQFNFSN